MSRSKGEVALKNCISIVAAVLMMISTSAYGAVASYEEITKIIDSTMRSSLSVARKESYGAIKFDRCKLEYTVSGTYPSGGLYTIKFSDLDFTSLNVNNSKTGQDYTDFIILNFNRKFSYKSDIDNLMVATTVINAADNEGANTLFKAFSLLGTFCGAQKSAEAHYFMCAHISLFLTHFLHILLICTR